MKNAIAFVLHFMSVSLNCRHC